MADDCIEWQGTIQGSGYGIYQIRINGKNKVIRVHRKAWEIVNGPIPDGLCVCHACDNRKCFNVNHLFLGSRLVNNHDNKAKGRKRGRPTVSGGFITEKQVAEIKILAYFGWGRLVIARAYGTTSKTILNIVRGSTRRPLEQAS